MWSRNSFVFGSVLLALTVLVDSQSDIYELSKRSSPQKLCGRHLIDTLSIVCNGVYQEHATSKKSETDPTYVEEDYLTYEQQLDEPSFPFRSRASASRFIPPTFRRVTRGINDECCKKPCTFAEMESYCGGKRRRTQKNGRY